MCLSFTVFREVERRNDNVGRGTGFIEKKDLRLLKNDSASELVLPGEKRKGFSLEGITPSRRFGKWLRFERGGICLRGGGGSSNVTA